MMASFDAADHADIRVCFVADPLETETARSYMVANFRADDFPGTGQLHDHFLDGLEQFWLLDFNIKKNCFQGIVYNRSIHRFR